MLQLPKIVLPAKVRRRAKADSRLTRSMREKGFLLCTEVADLVGVHKATVYRWVRDGRVRAKDFSGAYYVEWESVLEHLGEIADVLGLRKGSGNGKSQSPRTAVMLPVQSPPDNHE